MRLLKHTKHTRPARCGGAAILIDCGEGTQHHIKALDANRRGPAVETILPCQVSKLLKLSRVEVPGWDEHTRELDHDCSLHWLRDDRGSVNSRCAVTRNVRCLI